MGKEYGGKDMSWLSKFLVLVVVLVISSTSLWAAEGIIPGSGTEGDPYLIEDVADLQVFV